MPPVNTYFKNNGLGPLGKDYVPKIMDVNTAENGMSVTYEVELEPGRTYQIIIGQGYRMEDHVPNVPYLVEFGTRQGG